MRDRRDNVVVVCSIENLDPMGVHTGDSITVAPAMTLTDREYQHMRDVGIAVLRAVGVDTGGCNIQFAVQPADRPAGRDRDEPARVAVVRAGVQGHRLPDREDRRAAGGRLHPRRDPQRHHRRDARGVRADAGLRRGQGAAVRLREVPGRGPRADHHDEERRRGDGAGPLVRRGAGQGAALHGRRPGRVLGLAGPGRARRPRVPHRGADLRRRAGAARRRGCRGAGAAHRYRPVVPRGDRRDRRAGPGDRRRAGARRAAAAPGQARGALRPPAGGAASRVRRRRRRAHPAPPAGHPAGLQDRRHLCRRVRRPHAVPLQRLRDRSRRRVGDRPADRAAEGADPRVRAEPDRAGHRVRLLVRARGDGVARGRVRDRDGQLQPGDRLHGLRHRGPPLLRAVDLRGRARGRARRAGVRDRRRGDRAARRADPARARAAADDGGRPGGRDVRGGDRPGRGPRGVR